MQRGFRDRYGVAVPFAEINPIKDAERFNCSPATLAMLLRSSRERQTLPDGITASQAGSETRQLWLEETVDYYPTTDAAMSGYSGTLKHEQINVDAEGLIVEQRFVSKRNPRISAKIDHAAIVDLDSDGTLWVDLWDLKTAKWYSVTLMVKDVWKNKADYAWQLNLGATLLEEIDNVEPLCINTAPDGKCFCSGTQRIRVRNMYLECVPADASYNNVDEAKKLGVDFRKAIVPVTRRSADATYTYYERLLAEKDAAKAKGYAPLCKERWSNRKVQDLRCRFYCSVAEECKSFSLARGEYHPLATTEELLAASIRAKETA